MSTKRKHALSLEQRVYRWCVGKGDVTTKEVAKALRIGYWSAVQTVQRLCSKGSMVRSGLPSPNKRRYRATDLVPEDGRGLMGNSLKALQRGYNKARREIPRPKPATALEQAWGYLPVSTFANDRDLN